MKMLETIVAAAIQVDGILVEGYAPYKVVLSVERPGRHHHVAWFLGTHGVDHPDQGFLTNTGRYVDRQEAYVIAKAAGQILVKTGSAHVPTLYSEDVW